MKNKRYMIMRSGISQHSGKKSIGLAHADQIGNFIHNDLIHYIADRSKKEYATFKHYGRNIVKWMGDDKQTSWPVYTSDVIELPIYTVVEYDN